MSEQAPIDPEAPLRIAYLTYRGKPHVGGQGVYTRHLTKALVDLGHHVEVFSGQPYPVLDERVPLTDAAQPRPLQRPRTPAASRRTGRSRRARTSSSWPSSRPARSPSRSPSATGPCARSTPRVGEFDLVHDNQCLGYGILRLERQIPTIVTLHHPITQDRQLEMEHAPSRRKRWSVGRWYSFVKMQGRVASRHAADRRRQRELDPRHPHRHGRAATTACGSCRSASTRSCSGPARRSPACRAG